MKTFYLAFGFFILMNSFAQGLRCERGFNSNFKHGMNGVVCSGNETFVFHSFWTFNVPYAGGIKLGKIDEQGNTVWEVPATPEIGEIPEFLAAVEDDNSVVYLCGSSQACDYSTGYRYCMRKVNHAGDLIWQNLWITSGQSSQITFPTYP